MILAQFQLVENSLLLSEFRFGLFVMEILLFMCSLFLMALVLVQRGKGGGLTGALGGMGGQSAFGSKAGDAFTKITIVTAAIWIFLCMMTIALFNPPPAPQSTVNSDAVLNGTMGDPNDETGEVIADETGEVIADEAETTNADDAAEGVEIETVEEVSPEVKTPEVKTPEVKTPDTEPSKDATEAQPETSEEITESKSEVEKK
jgi:preprotein translocase subunit SecG